MAMRPYNKETLKDPFMAIRPYNKETLKDPLMAMRPRIRKGEVHEECWKKSQKQQEKGR